jgi:hypothetical protein
MRESNQHFAVASVACHLAITIPANVVVKGVVWADRRGEVVVFSCSR